MGTGIVVRYSPYLLQTLLKFTTWIMGTRPSFPVVHYVNQSSYDILFSTIPSFSFPPIRAHYLALPAQALQARMANIQPAGASWSMRAATLLYQMTVDKPIIAIVTSVKVVL